VVYGQPFVQQVATVRCVWQTVGDFVLVSAVDHGCCTPTFCFKDIFSIDPRSKWQVNSRQILGMADLDPLTIAAKPCVLLLLQHTKSIHPTDMVGLELSATKWPPLAAA
jgi:hypothetical protein